MSRLYTYIVTIDSGLAPNPFWDWCTLAVCTPNHQGSAVKPGDWLAGFSPKDTGYKFIYAMEVDECIHMNDYFNDPRFQAKKPRIIGSWKQRCGDNFYSQNSYGVWIQHPNPFHGGMLSTDTRNPYVFVAREFWYLGKARVETPNEFHVMIGGRGARVNHPKGLPEKFKAWVRSTFSTGVADRPLDVEPVSGCLSQAEIDASPCALMPRSSPRCRNA